MHKQAPDEVPRLSPPRWFALGALLVGALLPACAGTEAFPHWDLDPTRTWTPVTGITPPLSVAFAALSMIGASVALLTWLREVHLYVAYGDVNDLKLIKEVGESDTSVSAIHTGKKTENRR